MPSSYNHSAWFYDALSRIIYGKALVIAQVYLLQFVPAESNLLIVGGGTGWILEELAKIHPVGLKITYVEVAPDMMRLSKKRNTGNNEMIFINAAIEDVSLAPDFDLVIAPFLFDNFKEQSFIKIFDHIRFLLKPNGLWLISDFQLTGKWWQSILLETMVVFFKIICSIEASELPDIRGQFEKNGYELKKEQTFFGDFIVSMIYKR